MNDLEVYVEYHGWVFLKNAIDSHVTGLKVQYRLRDDNDLDIFKKVTKRRKGHAGQIYRMHYKPMGEDSWEIMDVWFLGVSWSHTNGATVAFELQEKCHWDAMREWPAIGEGKDVIPKEIEILLFRIGDDGEMINLKQRDHIEAVNELKGGPQSIRAARLSADNEFRAYVTAQVESLIIVSSEVAAAWMKKIVGYESRKQLDHNKDLLEKFEKGVMSPFNRWRWENE